MVTVVLGHLIVVDGSGHLVGLLVQSVVSSGHLIVVDVVGLHVVSSGHLDVGLDHPVVSSDHHVVGIAVLSHGSGHLVGRGLVVGGSVAVQSGANEGLVVQ